MPKHAILFTDSDSKKNHLKGLGIHFFNNPANLPECITPETPSCADPKEILVSEAMKRACNHNQKVIIIGVNKDDVVEKNIKCKYFKQLIEFMPEPVEIPVLFAKLSDIKKQKISNCKKLKYCIANKHCIAGIKHEDISQYNIYTGDVIHKICHIMSHFNLKEFIENIKYIELLKYIFIPVYLRDIIESFLIEVEELSRNAGIAEKDFLNNLEILLYQEDFKHFTHFVGGCNGYSKL